MAPVDGTGWLPINSLWPIEAILRHRSGSTLAHVMACCRTAPSHYLKQCWLIISKVQWHSFECEFARGNSASNHSVKLIWKLLIQNFIKSPFCEMAFMVDNYWILIQIILLSSHGSVIAGSHNIWGNAYGLTMSHSEKTNENLNHVNMSVYPFRIYFLSKQKCWY